MVIGLKFRIKEVEGLYYLPVCSKNKGTDQLLGYSTLCNGAAPFVFTYAKSRFSDATQMVLFDLMLYIHG